MTSDLATPDTVISALYESRSNRILQQPDWDRFRSLFIPNAVFAQTGTDFYVWHNRESYVEEHEQYHGDFPSVEFSQVEVSRETDSVGDIAHIFSTYDQHVTDGEGTSSSSGVNSFHLVRDHKGEWRITSWHWTAELPHDQD